MASFLCTEASVLLNELNLLPFLRQFGDARVVGSVALDVVVTRDIDVHMQVPPSLMTTMPTRVEEYLREQFVFDILIEERRKLGGINVRVEDHMGPSGSWNIDIWLTDRFELTDFSLLERLRRELLPVHYTIVQDIIRALQWRGELNSRIVNKVFLAVLEHGVHNIDEFVSRYLNRAYSSAG